MVVLYIIIGIVVVLFLSAKLFGGVKNIETYGPPRIFLNKIIRAFSEDFPSHKLIIENQGRIKIKFQSQSYSLTTDFIYQNTSIQVSLTFDSMVGDHKIRTFNCPYDVETIASAIQKEYAGFIGMPM
jgi:hypothetical protein